MTRAAGAGRERADSPAGAYRAVVKAVTGVRLEFSEIDFSGPRATQASMTALVVVVSVGVACAMRLPEVWWAAISGFISTQATRPASVQKGVLRMLGTVAGAALCLALVGWLAYDIFAGCLALFLVTSIGIVGVNVSRHGYAWLLFCITFALVLLMSLADPSKAFNFAACRTIEVGIGTAVSIVVAFAFAPEGVLGGAASPPGWTDLFGAQWPAVLHAVRAGVAVALIPLLWNTFYLADLSQGAVTMASVLAVPVLSDHPLDANRKMVEKAMHRMLGCFIGGIAGLILLGLPFDQFVPWLLALAGGTWLFTYVQASTRGIGYVDAGAGRGASRQHLAWRRSICRDCDRHGDPACRFPAAVDADRRRRYLRGLKSEHLTSAPSCEGKGCVQTPSGYRPLARQSVILFPSPVGQRRAADFGILTLHVSLPCQAAVKQFVFAGVRAP